MSEVAKNAKGRRPRSVQGSHREDPEKFPWILVIRPKVFPLLLGCYGDYIKQV